MYDFQQTVDQEKLPGLFFFFFFFFLRFYLSIFRERGRGGREREKYQCAVASPVPCTGDLAHNPGMCPDWESNWQLSGLQPTLNPVSYTSQGSLVYSYIH